MLYEVITQPNVVLRQAQTAIKVLVLYLLGALGALLLTRLLANRLAGNLVQRLQQLANASREAGATGHFLQALTATGESADEVDQLQAALVHSYGQIEALNANLEHQVVVRTQALRVITSYSIHYTKLYDGSVQAAAG